nr:MAG TPA: Major capsid protein [Caudoviricetes sp.]
MANNIALVTKYQPLLDEVYKAASCTSDLEKGSVLFVDNKTVKVAKVTTPKLASYSRNTGYTAGDVVLDWETHTLNQDRGIEFTIDAMDQNETLDMSFGAASSQFIRTQVVPEVDAYRFATMAQTAGVTTVTGALTNLNILEAIQTAEAKLDEDEVPEDSRILYITPTNLKLLEQELAAKNGLARITTSDTDLRVKYFDGIKIVKVPQTRFYSKIDVVAAGGFIKNAEDGKNINFMIVEKSAVDAVVKHAPLKIFSPDENQKSDGWKFQYRIYHDEFVYDNKAAGIYVHTVA